MSSCPDWKRLASVREAEASPFARDDAPGSAAGREWRQALDHLDSGCTLCRREALAVDPLLVFRRLPALEISAEGEEREIDSVLRAVAAMRTASRHESSPRTALNWRRWAAAAVLAVLSLSVGPWRVPGSRPTPSTQLSQRDLSAQQTVLPALGLEGANTVEAVENRPDARVYQMNDDGFSVTMIVDESFDV